VGDREAVRRRGRKLSVSELDPATGKSTADENSVAAAVAKVVGTWTTVDVLVNNAATVTRSTRVT
jgi:NAD(P)-dependent dehydrogenase (short-subunit alcohol dehydrogenase family)